MNVIQHAPRPVPVPPVTYDLLGLTWDEMLVIRHALLRAGDDRSCTSYKSAEAARLHVEITEKQGDSERASDDC